LFCFARFRAAVIECNRPVTGSIVGMIKVTKRSVLLFVLFVAILAAVVYLLYAVGLMDLFTNRVRLLNFIKEYRHYAVPIFIGLQVLQVLAAPLPGEITGFIGGVLFGPYWGVVYSTIGLTLGSWVAFNLARLLGRPLIERLVNPETLRRFDYVMKHKGLFVAFLLFLIPGFPKDYLCYALGLGHMRQREFLVICTIGRLLGTILLTLGGSLFYDERYRELFVLLGLSLFIVLIILIYRNEIERGLRRIRVAQWQRSKTSREERRERH
jgi:uncharacterized membrane protein YdjX (TVP38/TMEM64 family)